ncbi:MAG: hypothetical protein R3C26_24120 [Calditrichia bacterium]
MRLPDVHPREYVVLIPALYIDNLAIHPLSDVAQTHCELRITDEVCKLSLPTIETSIYTASAKSIILSFVLFHRKQSQVHTRFQQQPDGCCLNLLYSCFRVFQENLFGFVIFALSVPITADFILAMQISFRK